jgi:hypothetical protein
MGNNKSVFTITEISEWCSPVGAEFPNSIRVELPKVQRGFVWKPKQIEDLWDSLLRGYPVGSFVFNINEKKELQLLDGQQRATSITIGFANKTFKGTEKHVRLFIDLNPPNEEDARKYYFRVITDSHPWGYQLKSNNKPLEAQQKREAMKHFGDINVIDPDLSQCFPFEAALPIPFDIFLTSSINKESIEECINHIYNWHLFEKVKEKLNEDVEKKNKQSNRAREFASPTSDKYIKKRIETIYKEVNKMVQEQQIPALYLKNLLEINNPGKIKGKLTIELPNEEIAENDFNLGEEKNDEDEIENLFIRLNAGGTPLRGEDLNYSILKAKMDKVFQKEVEDKCKDFVSPARFLTVIFRVYQHKKKIGARDGLNMNIKPKQFQNYLGKEDQKKSFLTFLNLVFNEKIDREKTLIEYTHFILDYHPTDNRFGLPHLLVNKLVGLVPELLFILWHRIYINKDRLIIGSDIHRKMLGMLTLFYWFGKGINRDYKKLLKNMWPAVKLLEQDIFWSDATVRRAMLNEVLLPIPHFNKKYDKVSLLWFSKQKTTLKSSLFDRYEKISEAGYNTTMMFFNRDLILYAQRDFLFKFFRSKQFHLDDTNIPFDWDHISPSKFANKKNLPRLIKDFYNSIGNFRAWPYELNRMDSDDVPAIKFNPLKSRSNEKGLQKSWLNFIKKHQNLINKTEDIPEKLLEWSKCNKEWGILDKDDLRRDGVEVIDLIIERALAIFGIWYKDLLIESLIPTIQKQKTTIIEQAFNKQKFDINPKWLSKEHFNHDEVNLILKRPIKIKDSTLYIFLSFIKYPDELLNEGNILFGLYEKDSDEFINNLKIPEQLLNKYEYDKKLKYIQGSFTLISEHEESLKLLLEEILTWIDDKQSPIKKLKVQFRDCFLSALKVNYNPENKEK